LEELAHPDVDPLDESGQVFIEGSIEGAEIF
jgi:hypothetical protein